MLKWKLTTTPVVPKEVISVHAQKKKGNNKGNTYEVMDASFREEVDAVALTYFSQQQVPDKKIPIDQQITCLDIPQASHAAAVSDLKKENRQYTAWIKNIKTVLQRMQKSGLKTIDDYKNKWELSIESILKHLSIKNDSLTKDYKRKNKEIQFLETQVKEIEKENREIIHAIDAYNWPVEPKVDPQESGYATDTSEESIYSSTETIVPEEADFTYARRKSREYDGEESIYSSTETIVPEEADSISMDRKEDVLICPMAIRRNSQESGYATDTSEESIYSSTEMIVPEEPNSVSMQRNMQIIELEEKNNTHKECINSLNKKLNSNLTLKCISKALKVPEDLKIPSFTKVELKQKNKGKEEIIQSLEAQIVKNIEMNALYQDVLSEEIYLYKLDNLEKRLDSERKESEDIDSYFKELKKKADKLQENIETFTKCLTQTQPIFATCSFINDCN